MSDWLMTVVVVVGGGITALLTLNAVLSFAGHYRRELTWLRVQAAVLSVIGLVVAVRIVQVIG